MLTAYNTTSTYETVATYWGLEAADNVKPAVTVEIDTLSDSFILVEGDGTYGGAINYETTNTYDTTVAANYDGLVQFRDITNSVQLIDINRGRGPLAFNQFEAGTMTIDLVDKTSEFLPTNTASRHYPRLTPMRPIRVRATWSGNTVDLFRGYLDSIDMTWQPGTQFAQVTLTATDMFKVLSNLDTTVTGSAGDTPATRIGAVLDSFSFAASLRDFDTGTVTLQPFDGTRRSALEALQTVEQSESGAMFIDGAGKIVFRNRTNAFPTTTPKYIYSDSNASGVVPYSEIDVAYDDQLLYNKVVVTRTGGVAQEATDSTSVSTYQRRTLEVSNLALADDTQAATLASFLLAKRKDPGLRVEMIRVRTLQNLMTLSSAFGLNFLDVITVTRTAPSSTLTKNLVVSGIGHRITTDNWDTTIITQHQA